MIRLAPLAACLIALPAIAAPLPAPVAPGHGKATFIATYDSDGDGAVTQAEFDAVRQAGFAERDADGDGAISPKEYAMEFEARLTASDPAQREREMEQTYSRFDTLDDDADGAMSPAEFADSGAYMFTTLDSDENGVVDEADTVEAY